MTMRTTTWLGAGAVVLMASGVAALGATAVEDDLTVVKKAVKVEVAQVPLEDEPPAVTRRKGRRAEWLKIRVVEQKGGHKEETVSVTIPLAIVRLLGKDATVDLSKVGVDGLKNHAKDVRILELVDSLEPGSLLVEVREDDEHVRVWVE
jgi:hypothetical protein